MTSDIQVNVRKDGSMTIKLHDGRLLRRSHADLQQLHERLKQQNKKYNLKLPQLDKRTLFNQNDKQFTRYFQALIQHHGNVQEVQHFMLELHEDVSRSQSPLYHSDGSETCESRKRKSMEDYELLKVLGRGCMGKVLLARDIHSQQLVAIKSISKAFVIKHGLQEVQHALAEQQILSKLKHPFLIRLHSSFQSQDNLFLVMQYVCGGDLATQLALHGTFSVQRTRFYAAEITEGISELHRQGVIFRDLKPENVLLDKNGHVKLTDFGLSKKFVPHVNVRDPDSQKYRTNSFCGTAEYLAPEVLLEKAYSFEVDWWSLGTFVYEMIVGQTPFWHQNQAVMYRAILSQKLGFPDSMHSYGELCDFIAQLLVRDPTRRLGANANSQQVRQHIFFTRHLDWRALRERRVAVPYVPHTEGAEDVRWFDQEFTQQSPKISPAPVSPLAEVDDDFKLDNVTGDKQVEMQMIKSPLAHTTRTLEVPCVAMQQLVSMFEGYTFVSESIGTYVARFANNRQLSPILMHQHQQQGDSRRKRLPSASSAERSPPMPPLHQRDRLDDLRVQEMEFEMDM